MNLRRLDLQVILDILKDHDIIEHRYFGFYDDLFLYGVIERLAAPHPFPYSAWMCGFEVVNGELRWGDRQSITVVNTLEEAQDVIDRYTVERFKNEVER